MPLKKSVVAYVLLVGVPLAGLAAVLRAGSRLQAPPPIGGEWEVLTPAVHAPLSPEAVELARFRVSQSGRHIVIGFLGRTYAGTLDGDSVVARSRRPPGGRRDGCMQGPIIELRAHFDTVPGVRRMRAEFSAPGLPACRFMPVAGRRIDFVPRVGR